MKIAEHEASWGGSFFGAEDDEGGWKDRLGKDS